MRGVLLVLLGDIVKRASKARGVAGGEQMLRSGGMRFAGAAHFFGNGQVGFHGTILGFGMPVTPARSRRSRRKERFNVIHICANSGANLTNAAT
jgi:hypothetical protein